MITNKNKVISINIISTIVLQGISFFTAPIFSSKLGTTNYGIVTIYFTWVQIASAAFSLQAASTFAVARAHFSLEEQSSFQSSALTLASLSYLCFSLLTAVFVLLFGQRLGLDMPMVIVGLLHGWGMHIVSAMNGKFNYEFKANYNFFLSVGVAGITVLLSLLLIARFDPAENYWGRILGQAVVYVAVGCGAYLVMIHKGRTLYSRKYWTYILPISIPTVFHVLANQVLNQSDKLMIQQQMDNAAVGIYGLASKFALVMNAIWGAFNNTWAPFYYEYTRKGQIDEMKRHARNYMELFSVLTMGFMLLSREVFLRFAPEDFQGGLELLPLFVMGIFFVFLYSFPVNFEFYHKKTRTIAGGTLLAAFVNIVLNYWFIRWKGIMGAVVATMAAHFVQFLFHYLRARRIREDRFPFRMRDFLPWIGIVTACCSLCYVLVDAWAIRWGLGAALGIWQTVKMIKRHEIF